MKNSKRSTIKFDYNGRHYELMFTANSLKKMEKAGVKFAKLDEAIFTAQETIFWGAFLANYPSITRKETNEIYRALKRTAEDMEAQYDEDGNEVDALAEALGAMLNEAVDELSARGNEGNVSWKMT